jgi:hypothetical protein
MSLTVENSKIKFINSGNVGRSGLQEDFTLSRNEVGIVGLKFSIFLDDDEYFIVFVDYKGRCYLVNSMHINKENFVKVQNIFQIDFSISKYGADYYEDEKSVVKYPLLCEGQPLFKTDKTLVEKMKLTWSRLTERKNPAWDYLSESSKRILQEKSL